MRCGKIGLLSTEKMDFPQLLGVAARGVAGSNLDTQLPPFPPPPNPRMFYFVPIEKKCWCFGDEKNFPGTWYGVKLFISLM